MKTKIFSIMAAPAMAQGGQAAQNGQPFSDLQSAIDSAISSLKAELTTMITNVQSELDTLKSDLNGETAARTAADSKLQSAIDTQAASVAELQSQVEQLQTEVDQLQTAAAPVAEVSGKAINSFGDGIDVSIQKYSDGSITGYITLYEGGYTFTFRTIAGLDTYTPHEPSAHIDLGNGHNLDLGFDAYGNLEISGYIDAPGGGPYEKPYVVVPTADVNLTFK